MNNPIIENKHKLEWNGTHHCVFTAEITNGLITDLHFCEPPVGEAQACLKTTNEFYLRQVAENLTEMFKYVDAQRAKTGSFSVDEVKEDSDAS